MNRKADNLSALPGDEKFKNFALMKEVLDVSQRQREPYIHHHGELDDFMKCLEVANGFLAMSKC